MPKFTVEEVSPIERRIKVEVEPERVAAELDRTYKTLSRQVRVPGFRPGKVPRRILEARYRQHVEGEVIQSLVEASYIDAVGAHPDLIPVGPPRVNSEELKSGEPFRYQAHVEIKPKIEPKDYEGLEVKKAKTEITDVHVDAEIEKLRQAVAQLVPVEGRTVAQKGDFAVIHYVTDVEGQPFQAGKADGVTVEITPGEFTQGHIEALDGAAIGETRELSHAFPKEHRLSEVAGKNAIIKITLDELRTKKLPEPDDTFANSVVPGSTLAQLKERIRDQLTDIATETNEREVRTQLLQQLVLKNPFEVPRSMVERQVKRMIEDAAGRLQRQGLDPRKMNLDVNRLSDSMRPRAELEVRGALLLEAIAEKESIEAKPEDVDAHIKKLAQKLKAPEELVRAQITSADDTRALGFQVREEKTLAFLESKAKISQP